jgi:hypothetical protein
MFGINRLGAAAVWLGMGYHVFTVLMFAGSWLQAAVAAACLVLFIDDPLLRRITF